MNMNDAFVGSLIFNKNSGGGKIVPYVYSTAQQYVALPLYDDDNFVIEAKIIFSLKNIQAAYIGDGGWSIYSFVLYNENNGALVLRYNNSNPGIVTIPTPTELTNTFHDITMNSVTGILTFDGVSYGGTPVREHWQVGLFGQNVSSRLGYCGFAYIRVYKDGDFYLNLVPMYDKENDAGYLYDTVNEQSYYSLTATPLKYAETIVQE